MVWKTLFCGLVLVAGVAIGRAPHHPYNMHDTTPEAQPEAPATLPQYRTGEASEVRVEMQGGSCSGTVVGNSGHVILTAMHCVRLGGAITKVDGRPTATQVMSTDGHDHIFVHVDIPLNKPGAQIDQRPLPAGTEVYCWGNPADMTAQLRIGRIAGAYVYDGVHYISLDIDTWHGDSGAGFFDASGHVVAVVYGHNSDIDSDGTSWMMRLAEPLAFTPAQLKEAGA